MRRKGLHSSRSPQGYSSLITPPQAAHHSLCPPLYAGEIAYFYAAAGYLLRRYNFIPARKEKRQRSFGYVGIYVAANGFFQLFAERRSDAAAQIIFCRVEHIEIAVVRTERMPAADASASRRARNHIAERDNLPLRHGDERKTFAVPPVPARRPATPISVWGRSRRGRRCLPYLQISL